MARILLGVTGGIAAYKALELARLATKAGTASASLMTPAAKRFVGAASFEGIVGAPVLTDEFERDPLRGAFPGEPLPEHDPIGHLEVVANADAYLVAPASANTIAKLAAGIADSMVTTSFLACAAPRLVAPAMNDRMYRDAATQANLETLRERGVDGDRARRGRAGLPRRARRRPAAGAARSCSPRSRPRCRGRAGALGRPAGARHRRRHPRADRPRSLHRQPLERPDGTGARRARRATRRGRDAGRRQRLAAGAARGAAVRRRDRRASSPRRWARRSRRRRAADGRRGGRLPRRERRRRGRSSARGAGGWSSPRADGGHPRRARRPAPRRTRRSSGSRPSTAAAAIERARGEARAQGRSTRSSSTTSRARRSASTRSENEVTIVERDGEHEVPLASKERDRRGDPRSGRGAARASAGAELSRGSAASAWVLHWVHVDTRPTSPSTPSTAGHRAARGRQLRGGDGAARARPRARRPRRARSARRSAAPTSAPASSRRPRPSSRRWSRPTRSTTSRTSASAGRSA